jgi:hypothetical protein
MYLEGRKYLLGKGPKFERPTEDGFPLKEKKLELGYWRKEPNLHGFIVQTFADGKDECQDIELGTEDLIKIKEAVVNRTLPHTTGFFFGAQCDPNSEDPQEREWALQFEKDTVEIFDKAVEWVNAKEDGAMRWVVYRASW